MPAVGKFALIAGKDVSANAKIKLSELFPYPERGKEFTLEAAVQELMKFKVTIDKIGTVDMTANTTKDKGEKINLPLLTKYFDLSQEVKPSKAIKKGDVLNISIKTA